MSREYAISNKDIEEIKREFREEHMVIGTNDPVIISNETAKIVLRSRKGFEEYLNSVHGSHTMTEWECKIMTPAGTSRFYYYRECTKCGGEQYHHPAGRFINPELKRKCLA